jgi:hypothetical protein
MSGYSDLVDLIRTERARLAHLEEAFLIRLRLEHGDRLIAECLRQAIAAEKAERRAGAGY